MPHRKTLTALLTATAVALAAAAQAAAQSRPLPDGSNAPPPHLARVLRVPSQWPTIQDAIDRAHPGDVVLVAPGTYLETIDFRGKAIEVIGTEGPTRTTILPPSAAPVVLFRSGEGADSRLMGFTIRGGQGDFDGSGGGVSCVSFATGVVASPYLSDCILTSNFTDSIFGNGPGAAGIEGNATLERCVLSRNHADFESGGAVRGAVTMLSCVVEDNFGCEGGGGLHLLPGSLVQDCVIRRNAAGPCSYHGGAFEAPGGGIYAPLGPIEIVGSVLQENWVEEFPEPGDPSSCLGINLGGGVNVGPGVTLRRCTLVGNRVHTCALVGGIYGSPTLIDSIVQGNDDAPGYYAAQSGFRFSNVQGGAAGAGCFDADPLFVDASTGDVRLRDDSPCIDAGDPASPLDADGTRADLGAEAHSALAAPLRAEWHESARLQAQDLAHSVEFGTSVALDGDTALIGACALGYGGSGDGAYVLRRAAASWSQTAHLTASDQQPDDDFGGAVALDGKVAVVGAPLHESAGFLTGAAYVFERDSLDAPFVETQRLVQSGVAGFGMALALDSGTLVVGAGQSEGSVHVYRREARGRWLEVAEFRPPPYFGSFLGSQFGSSVALSGDTLVVGAPGYEADDQIPGRAFVYERAGATPFSWVQTAILAPTGTRGLGNFGVSTAITGNSILVGSNFGAYAFERGGPGLPWTHRTRIGPSEPTRVLAQRKRAWLTSPAGVTRELAQTSPGAPWTEVASFQTGVGPLAADQGTLLAGAPFEDSPAGAVHVFERGVQLDSIEGDQAADLDLVILRGRELDTVTEVRVDGVAQPIERQSANEIALRPARRDPGFSELELVTPAATLTLGEGFESLPTLRASHNGIGGTLRAQVHNGTSGAYRLRYSLDLRPTPLFVTDPPTWYGLFLRLTRGRSGVLVTETFPGDGVAEPAIDLPNDPGLVGLTLHLQAWCRRGLFGPAKWSFTNVASVTL